VPPASSVTESEVQVEQNQHKLRKGEVALIVIFSVFGFCCLIGLIAVSIIVIILIVKRLRRKKLNKVKNQDSLPNPMQAESELKLRFNSEEISKK